MYKNEEWIHRIWIADPSNFCRPENAFADDTINLHDGTCASCAPVFYDFSGILVLPSNFRKEASDRQFFRISRALCILLPCAKLVACFMHF